MRRMARVGDIRIVCRILAGKPEGKTSRARVIISSRGKNVVPCRNRSCYLSMQRVLTNAMKRYTIADGTKNQ